MSYDLAALLNAECIAVVGASPKPGSFGGQVLKNLVEIGFTGELYGVHPRETEIFGQATFPSIRDLPRVPDLIALAVANHHLLGILEDAGEMGIKATLVFGDPTVGVGRAPELQDQIAEIAARYQIAVCGPNAMGIYALHRKFVISGYPVDPRIGIGNIALITHSGTVFDSLSQNNRQVNFNYVVAGGNEAVLTAADYLKFVLQDDATKVVALYLETVRDPELFLEGLTLAREKRIPVVALKTGLSEHGQRMTQAHTGALAGGAQTYHALFDRYGVIQVHTLDEMMDTIELLSVIQHLPGPNLSVLMESGGERSHLADHASYLNHTFTEFNETTQQRLLDVLEPGVHPDNPLDAFGSGHNVMETYRDCLKVMDADPETGLTLLAVDFARDSYLSPNYQAAVLTAQSEIKKPLTAMVNLTAGAGDSFVAALRVVGVPVLMGTETGLRALKHLIEFSKQTDVGFPESYIVGRPDEATLSEIRQRIQTATGPLDEYASKKVLAAYGLPAPQEALAVSVEEAVALADSYGYPVVMKTAVEGILHKSDVGGVRLNISNAAQAAIEADDLIEKLGTPILVQAQANMKDAVELFLGMQSDPQFGPLLLVGLGGVFIEVYKDVVAFLPPVVTGEPEQLIARLQGLPLLQGTRGKAGVDLPALYDAVVRFATLALDLGDLVEAIEVNPLLMRPDGALMLDALIIPNTPTF